MSTTSFSSAPSGLVWARRQLASEDKAKFQRPENQGGEFNIWFSKFQGDDRNARTRAVTRVHVHTDAGLTRGNFLPTLPPLCVYFAKGACVSGPDCLFLHRLPQESDIGRVDLMHDVFGRERHATERADNGGTGCFNRDARTLYVGDLTFGATETARADEILARHFGEFGPLEQIAFKPKYAAAFIRFTHRIYAEFAHVAMADQALDDNEMVNCRWANDDPNPKAIEQVQHNKERQLFNGILKSGLLQPNDNSVKDLDKMDFHELERMAREKLDRQEATNALFIGPISAAVVKQREKLADDEEQNPPAVISAKPNRVVEQTPAVNPIDYSKLQITPEDTQAAYAHYCQYYYPQGYTWEYYYQFVYLPSIYGGAAPEVEPPAEIIEKPYKEKPKDRLATLLAGVGDDADLGETAAQDETLISGDIEQEGTVQSSGISHYADFLNEITPADANGEGEMEVIQEQVETKPEAKTTRGRKSVKRGDSNPAETKELIEPELKRRKSTRNAK